MAAATKKSTKVGATTKKRSKSVSAAKSSAAATVVEPAVNEPSTRVSRRSAVIKSLTKATASPSPSPARKVPKKKVASKKSKKVGAEDDESEVVESKAVAKSVPVASSKPTKQSSSSSSTTTTTSKSSCKQMIRVYLIIYNSLSALAWFFLLFKLGKSFFHDDLHNYQVLFEKTGMYLAYLQSAALLEVLHAALGWVRSGVMSNVIQIASRLFVIWVATVLGINGRDWAYTMMAVAWSLSDFTRYAYYLTQLTGTSAPILKWCRYNFFLVLYPVGTIGEVVLMFFARIKWDNNLFIYYGLLLVMSLYTPGFLHMYSHMLQQRSKHFTSEPIQAKAKSAAASKSRKVKSK